MILLPYLGFRGKLKEWLFRQLVQGNSWKSLDIILHYCIPFSKLLCLNCHPVPFCIQFHWCFTGFDSLLHKAAIAAIGMKQTAASVSSATLEVFRLAHLCPPHIWLCVLRKDWCIWDYLSRGTDQQNWHTCLSLLTSGRKELQHSFSLLVKRGILWVLIVWQVQHCWVSFLNEL